MTNIDSQSEGGETFVTANDSEGMSIAEIETQAFSEFGVQPKNEDEKKPLSLGSTPFVFTPFAPKAAEPVKVV